MLRIRLKMGPSMRNKEWTCCFGLHVRTVTIIIGIWHLCLNLLALGIISVIVRTNNYHLLLDDMNDDGDSDTEQIAPILPTPLSKVDRPYAYIERFQQPGLHSNDVDMSGLVFLCMIAVTLMLIYGAVKGRPSHLLPFFCLQIFDFAIATVIHLVGKLFNMAAIDSSDGDWDDAVATSENKRKLDSREY